MQKPEEPVLQKDNPRVFMSVHVLAAWSYGNNNTIQGSYAWRPMGGQDFTPKLYD